MTTHYTQEDLAQVKRAILDLSTGERVARVTHNGRTVDYASTDIDKLRALERYIRAELLEAEARSRRKRRTRTIYAATGKGL